MSEENAEYKKLKQEIVLTPEQQKEVERRAEMLRFCHLDFADEQTQFIDLQYDEGRQGRTVVVMGASGLHARMKGNQKSLVWNESLALNQEKENEYDVSTSIRRGDCFGVTVTKVKTDTDQGVKITYNVIISITSGHVTLYGLDKQSAILFKKQIWNWMNFINYQLHKEV